MAGEKTMEIASSRSPLPIYSSRSVYSDRPEHCHTEGRGERAKDGTRCGGMGTAGFRRGHVPVRVPRFIPIGLFFWDPLLSGASDKVGPAIFNLDFRLEIKKKLRVRFYRNAHCRQCH